MEVKSWFKTSIKIIVLTGNDKQSCKVSEFDLPSVGGQLVPG